MSELEKLVAHLLSAVHALVNGNAADGSSTSSLRETQSAGE